MIPQGYKQTEIGIIPEDWALHNFGEKVTVLRGGSPRPITAYLTKSNAGINWIKIGDVKPGEKYINSMGGVLFIDEAYTLALGGDRDFGQEAIATLLKEMEDRRGMFCVIFAGYRDEMEFMIASNPGLESRIARKIDFPDYDDQELMQIFKSMLTKKKYKITREAEELVAKVIQTQSVEENFANARSVRNLVDSLIEIQSVRTLEDEDEKNDLERIIMVKDVKQYIKEYNQAIENGI